MTVAEITNIIVGILVLIGGVTVLLKRLGIVSFGGEKKTNGYIKPSSKTGGAMHISEDGLERVKEIEDRLKADFRTKENQDTVCRGVAAELKLYIKDALEENSEKIIKAVKGQ